MPQQQTTWAKTKTTSKAGFDKLWGWADKLGAPVNKLSNKLGSEAFWPTTLDKESDKAARILRSFCKDGFYDSEVKKPQDGPTQKQRVLKKIPPEVIRNAKGLAIFTTMRTGLWMSGAGGSGVLLGRTKDGSWSPPSGILLHTAGLGFLVGVDIYDCVVVINTQKALDAFSKLRCTLGGEISAVAGPVGAGGVLETEVHKRQAPIFTYLKSRGFYAGVQVDGTIVIERTDENERFYHQKLPVADILAGKVRHPPYELKTLMETVKAAEGDKKFDASFVPSEPPPGDYEVREEGDGHIFGIPDKEDPDPFGVKALQEAGLEIREATTRARASADDFEFKPSPTSPIYPAFNRRSMDSRSAHSLSRRSSWRTSTLSAENRTPTVDSATQTEFGGSGDDAKSDTSPKRTSPHRHSRQPSLSDVPEHHPATISPTTSTPLSALPSPPPAILTNGHHHDASTSTTFAHELAPEPEAPEPDAEDDPIVVHEAAAAASPQLLSKPQLVTTTTTATATKARLVTVPKRAPPALPPRNPGRAMRKGSKGSLLSVNSEVGSAAAEGGQSPVSAVSMEQRPGSGLGWRRSGEEGRRSVDARVDSANGFEGERVGERVTEGEKEKDNEKEKEKEKEKVEEKSVGDAVHEVMATERKGSPVMPGAFEDEGKEDFS
ncbi:MAG: hypothetical protein Q9165_006920 [Trypethelium subeluteriae]